MQDDAQIINDSQAADDAQMSVEIEDNAKEKQQKLPEDNSRPFSPPSGVQDTIPADDQSLDTNIDAHEWYDEGRSGAAEKVDPGNRGVLSYKPKRFRPRENMFNKNSEFTDIA